MIQKGGISSEKNIDIHSFDSLFLFLRYYFFMEPGQIS